MLRARDRFESEDLLCQRVSFSEDYFPVGSWPKADGLFGRVPSSPPSRPERKPSDAECDAPPFALPLKLRKSISAALSSIDDCTTAEGSLVAAAEDALMDMDADAESGDDVDVEIFSFEMVTKSDDEETEQQFTTAEQQFPKGSPNSGHHFEGSPMSSSSSLGGKRRILRDRSKSDASPLSGSVSPVLLSALEAVASEAGARVVRRPGRYETK